MTDDSSSAEFRSPIDSGDLPPVSGTETDRTLMGTSPSESSDFEINEHPEYVGGHKILELLGEGGMGAVYVAQQTEPVRRKVAIKIIRAGMASKHVRARFAAEQQALAMMDHPNIAKIFEAGMTEDGNPYLVMELVQGIPITEYADAHQLDIPARLNLFVTACHAVQHAHHKGVIHRDIKPTNIMVADIDGAAVVKVIDFGLAKAIDQDLTDQTLYTMFSQMIGTPLYMSPEQAAMGVVDVDTRSDVYSLGVLLYELLTGKTPFDRKVLKKAGFDEMRRIIREEEPRKPSTALSTLERDKLKTISDLRRIDRRRLPESVRGELDWIVMQALEKDRSRRYESAAELARDIQRHLNNEPVRACPPSTLYHLRKMATRHKVALVTASMVTAALTMALGVSIWQGHEADEARRRADGLLEKERIARSQADAAVFLARQQRQQLLQSLYTADMKLASDAMADGDVPRLTKLLQRHLPKPGQSDLRTFPWFYLNGLVNVPKAWSHDFDQRVWSVTVSPSGDMVAAGTRLGVLNIYDIASGELIDQIANFSEINDVAWSPDGTRLVSGHESGLINLWTVQPGSAVGKDAIPIKSEDAEFEDGSDRRVNSWYGHRSGVKTLLFTPDGKEIVSGGGDNMIRRWNSGSGDLIDTLEGHDRAVEEIDLARDGIHLASASSDQTLGLWNLQSGERLRTWDTTGRAVTVDISPDSTYLVGGDIDGNLFFSNLKSEQTIRVQHPDGIEAVKLLEDGLTFAAGDRGGAIHVWSAIQRADDSWTLSSRDRSQWLAHDGRVESIAIDHRRKQIISGSRDGTIACWAPRDIDRNSFRSTGLAVTNRGSVLGCRYEIWRFDSRGKKLLDAFGPNAKMWDELHAAKNAPRAVASGFDPVVAVFDLNTGERISDWNVERLPSEIRMSDDGNRVAVRIHAIDKVIVFEVGKEEPIADLSIEQCSCIGFSRDGRTLAVGALDDILLLDTQTFEVTGRLVGHDSTVAAVVFHPSENTIASVGNDRLLKLWDLSTHRELNSTEASRFRVIRCLDFSADGQLLATGGSDGFVNVWDAETFQPLLEIATGHPVVDVAFSLNGSQIIASLQGEDYHTIVYDATRQRALPSTTGSTSAPAEFTPMRLEENAVVSDLARNGSFVVGTAGKHAFAWSPDRGMVQLRVPEDVVRARAEAISDVGGTILAQLTNADGNMQLGQWNDFDSAAEITFRPSEEWKSLYGNVINGDSRGGIALRRADQSTRGFLLQGDNFIELQRPDEATHCSVRFVPSNQRDEAIGQCWNGPARPVAQDARQLRIIRWKKNSVVELPGIDRFDSDYQWFLESASDNAQILIGSRWQAGNRPSEQTTIAFRWEDGEFELLGDLPHGFVSSRAFDASADGQVIVGQSSSELGQEAMIWTRSHGMRRLSEVVRQYGGQPEGWHLTIARSISADGTTIAGMGINPNGKKDGYLVRLPVEAIRK